MRRIGWIGLAALLPGCSGPAPAGSPATPPTAAAFEFHHPFETHDPGRSVDPYITDGVVSWRIAADGGLAKKGQVQELPYELEILIDGEPLDPTKGRDYRQSYGAGDQSLSSESSPPESLSVIKTSWTHKASHIARGVSARTRLSEKLTINSVQSTTISVRTVHQKYVSSEDVRRFRFLGKETTKNGVDGWRDFLVTSDEPLVVTNELHEELAPPLFPPIARIRIVGSVEDDLAVRSMAGHLRANINPAVSARSLDSSDEAPRRASHQEGDKNDGLGPFGSSHERYQQMVFWDADIWMFPALAMLDPKRAKRIADFRLGTVNGARAEYVDWVEKGRPSVDPRRPIEPNPDFTSLAASEPIKYPWEADADGREQSPTETIHQIHITGDVALMLEWAAALGIAENDQVDEVKQGAAAFYANRMILNDQGKTEIRDVISPDEFHRGNNDLYTNMLVERLMTRALPRWDYRMHLPQDETSFLTYDDDKIVGYKQAAALLTVWPLQDPRAEAQAMAMLDRFHDKTTPNGPAMSGALHALIRARYGDPNEALEEWRESWQKYTNRDWLYFSERPTKPDTYFLTGAAGCLNTVLYGFIGLRMDESDPGDKPWKRELTNGWWLSCDPNLPDEWNSITIEPFSILGESFLLVVSHEGVEVEAF
jgi:hypothetical protein